MTDRSTTLPPGPPPDELAAVDKETFDPGPFIEYNRPRLRNLCDLTVRFRNVDYSMRGLNDPRRSLGKAKGKLLENQFKAKYPHPEPVEDRFKQTPRSIDYARMLQRRYAYQSARLAYALAIANLAEDARALMTCVNENLRDLARGISEQVDRDVTMHNVWLAERLLDEAKRAYQQAVAHLGEQEDLPVGLWHCGVGEGIKRVLRDGRDLSSFWLKVPDPA